MGPLSGSQVLQPMTATLLSLTEQRKKIEGLPLLKIGDDILHIQKRFQLHAKAPILSKDTRPLISIRVFCNVSRVPNT